MCIYMYMYGTYVHVLYSNVVFLSLLYRQSFVADEVSTNNVQADEINVQGTFV